MSLSPHAACRFVIQISFVTAFDWVRLEAGMIRQFFAYNSRMNGVSPYLTTTVVCSNRPSNIASSK